LTGIQDVPAAIITVRIGGFIVFGNRIIGDPIEIEPGVFILDFELPPLIDGAGDVPIVIEVTGGGTVFRSRLDDTAVKVNIL
jgi:hydrogenase maturation factor HypE